MTGGHDVVWLTLLVCLNRCLALLLLAEFRLELYCSCSLHADVLPALPTDSRLAPLSSSATLSLTYAACVYVR
jgi:hypothetical protein